MKNKNEIENLLKAFSKKFSLPIDPDNAMQGSDLWFRIKLGVISASNASKLLTKKSSETRNTYMSYLVAQVCTGIIEELNFKQMEWGKLHEDGARSAYEFETGNSLIQIPFCFKNETFREGCSPDFLVSDKKGGEIKCPWTSENYIKFLCADKIKSEYEDQVQYTMRVLDAESWDFAQYDPRMGKSPFHVITVERDLEKQKLFNEAVPEFVYDMDQMLNKIGVTFGYQWRK